MNFDFSARFVSREKLAGVTKGLLLSSASSLVFLAPGTAWATCDFSGAITSQHCDSTYIQGLAGTGASALTVSGETTQSIVLSTDSVSATPTTQTLTIESGTVVDNPSYSAVFSQTFAPDHDIAVFIESGVSITATDGNGVWLRNDVSGDLWIESAATITASGAGQSGITLTTNEGNAYLKNTGNVTSQDFRGLYADGGYNNPVGSPALVQIINEGDVQSYEAGARAINYRGLASIVNGGTVTTTARQGLVAWSADGDASITNSGTVTAHDDIALQAWSETGDVTVLNTGTLKSYDDLGHVDTGAGHVGIQTTVGTSGNTSITNDGVIEAPDGTGIEATTTGGNILINNTNSITALRGVTAVTGSGTVDIFNSGAISATETGVTLTAASLNNTGTIDGATYGVYLDGSGNTLANPGQISGGTASVFFGAGGNTLIVGPSSAFTGVVDYNHTVGNTTKFGAGSYHIPAAGYLDADNTIMLDNSGQQVVLDSADTSGTINVVSAAPFGSMVGQYTGSVTDIIGSILSVDVDRPVEVPAANGVQPSAYAEIDKRVAEAKAALTLESGTAVDSSGNLFWARAFGGVRQQSETSSAAASRIYRYGTITGVDHEFDDMRLGLFVGGGGVEARLDDDTSKLDGYTGFFGVYGSQKLPNDVAVNASVTFGGIDNHSSRSVNAGAEWAKGDFWGWYVSPEVSLSKKYQITPVWTMTPSLRLRYTGVAYDSYTETESSQNIAYSGRNTHTLDERLQLDLTRRYDLASAQILSLTFSGAVLDTQNLGDRSMSASLGGTGFEISDNVDRNVYGASLGVSFDYQFQSNMSVYGGIEGKALSGQAVDASALLGVKYAF
jgi:outer membrane autotransporter protein